jgi:CHAD domain-containing protein
VPIDQQAAEKAFRKVGKRLKNWSKSPPPADVRTLRTNCRRIKTITRALEFDSKRVRRRLLKPLGLLQKRAGKIRDMDVLLGDVISLKIPGDRDSDQAGGHAAEQAAEQTQEQNCLLGLLQYLAVKRHRQARKMGAMVRELGRPLRRTLARERSAIAKVARENSRSSSGDEQAESPSVHAAARGLQLAEQLNQPARLGPTNLHPYRLKLKELRYVLELEEPQPARQELIDAIKKVQDAIGEWHDWMSLGDIAADVLDHDRCRVIAQIKATAASRFANALAAAQSLRSRYAAKSPSGRAQYRKTSRKGGGNSHVRGSRQKLPRQKLNVLPGRTLKATAADIA